MITIEDLLEELERISITRPIGKTSFGGYRLHVNPISSPADRKFLQDLSNRTSTGGRFSTKQAYIACRIIKKYAHLYKNDNSSEISIFNLSEEQIIAVCDNPTYRTVPYESTNVPREVRYLGNRKLGFKSKYSHQIIDRIKSLSDKTNPVSANYPYFNKKYRIWVVDVTEWNLKSVMTVIKRFKFEFDEEVVQFLSDCSNATKRTSSAVVNDEQKVIHIVNQNNNLLATWLEDVLIVEENFDV